MLWKTIEGGINLADKELYRKYIIEKLNGYGIYSGPNGENLRTMDYYDLRGFVSVEEMKRDDEPLRSA